VDHLRLHPSLPLTAAEVLVLWDVENVRIPAGVEDLHFLRLALKEQLHKMFGVGTTDTETEHNLTFAVAETRDPSTNVVASSALRPILQRMNRSSNGFGLKGQVKIIDSAPKKESADHALRTALHVSLEKRREEVQKSMLETLLAAASEPWRSVEELGGLFSKESRSGRLIVVIVTKDADFLEHVGDCLRSHQRVVLCFDTSAAHPNHPNSTLLSTSDAQIAYQAYEDFAEQQGAGLYLLNWDELMNTICELQTLRPLAGGAGAGKGKRKAP